MTATNLDDSFNAAPPVRDAVPTRVDVLGCLKWSSPREVNTKAGPRLVSSADAGETVFALWRREQDALRSAGYSLGQFRGKWQISKWEKLPEKIVVKREEAKALSRATDADINVPAPDGLAYLGYQRAGIAYAFERPATLIGSEMGLGKSVMSCGLINCLPDAKRILIVCPASLKLNWRNELNRWLVRKRAILIADSKTFCALADGITVINYDVLHCHAEDIRTTEWDLLIADEAHFLKNPKARRTRMVFGERATKKEKDNGAADIPGIVAKKRILLTGTPIANKPVEIWPLINYLDPITWGNFFKFAIRYCAASRGQHGWDFSGASHLEELQNILRGSIMVRQLKRDVLTELPPKRRMVIEFPATGALARVARAESEAYEEVDDLEAEVELAAASEDMSVYESAVAALAKGQRAVFEGLSTLRRETAEAKIPLVVEHLRQALEESPKVVVFAHHKSVVAAIAKEFGDAAVQLVGDTPMQERQDAVDRFQKDPSCKLFIGSIMAAGVGITLTAASHVVFCELDWVPGNVSQAEDRCHRIGQKDSVLVQHLVLEGSLDATMARRIIAKQEVIDRALDVVTEKSPPQNGATRDGPPPRPKGDPRDLLAAEADKMTDDERAASVEAIRFLAMRCNGARDWDGAGFSKSDTRLGRELAAKADSVLGLSGKQIALARKVAYKYRGQLPDGIVARMKSQNA